MTAKSKATKSRRKPRRKVKVKKTGFSLEDTIKSKELVKLFPDMYQKQKMWHKEEGEEGEWKEVPLKNRLDSKNYTFTSVNERHGVMVYEVSSKTQKVRWCQYESKMEKKLVVTQPMVVKLAKISS